MKNFKILVTGNGNVDIYNKIIDKAFTNLINFEDTADFGESYMYKSDNKATYASEFDAKVNVIENNDFVKIINISRDMLVLEKYDFVDRKRSEEKVSCNVNISLILEKHAKTIKLGIWLIIKHKTIGLDWLLIQVYKVMSELPTAHLMLFTTRLLTIT